MSEEISKEQVKDVKASSDKPVKKEPATKVVAEESKVVANTKISEQKSTIVNEDGQKVIAGSTRESNPNPISNLGPGKETGAISSKAADRASKPKQEKVVAKTRSTKKVEEPKEPEKVALWSNKNIRWTGVGTLSKGYNIVTKEAAEKWLTRDGIREASPEEVATYYGK